MEHEGRRFSIRSHLYLTFAGKTHEHEKQDRSDVIIETSPIVYVEDGDEGSNQHKKYGSRSQDCASHQHKLAGKKKVFVLQSQS